LQTDKDELMTARANDGMEALSRRLCEDVAGWRFEDLPPDVVHTTKLFILDTLGVIGGGARAPGIAEIRGRMTRWENGGPATSLIGRGRMSPPQAALVNGATAHALDFDDIHDPARVHAFCVMLPTMLATAEDIGKVSGREFLLALAVGAEIHARLGLAAYNCLGKGWHPTMTLGVLAGALGAGKLLRLDAGKLLNALGLALHQACGTAQSMHDGVLAKRLGAGFAARGAVTAAFLAQDGVTGPFRPLEGEAGLFNFLERGEFDLAPLMENLRGEWRMRGYSYKPYPCCRCNHTTIALALGLRAQGLKPADVADVEILLPKVNFQTVGQPYDVTRKSVVHAQFNARYTFARALTDGKLDLNSYSLPAAIDPAVAAVAGRVSVSIDVQEAATDMAPSKIKVTRKDGAVLEVASRAIPGSPDAPMTEAEIVDKFKGCMSFGLDLPESDAAAFAETVLAVEGLADVSELARAFPLPR
jgi:2-methylcitrate dehydratase PrpD